MHTGCNCTPTTTVPGTFGCLGGGDTIQWVTFKPGGDEGRLGCERDTCAWRRRPRTLFLDANDKTVIHYYQFVARQAQIALIPGVATWLPLIY